MQMKWTQRLAGLTPLKSGMPSGRTVRRRCLPAIGWAHQFCIVPPDSQVEREGNFERFSNRAD